ncbi:transporter substrate-binding domain-containing protein, partial [Thioclava sp. BHET1]
MKKTWTAALIAGLALSASSAFAADPLAAIKMDQALHDRLPAEIKDKGAMISVENGSFPPYTIVDGAKLDGATADMQQALGKLLGIKITHANVGGLPALLTGINSGRYQMALGPIGDFKSREGSNDFVDWVKEYVVFAVHKGNPKKITSLDSSCGTRIAVMAGGSAERVIQAQSEACTKAGKPAVTVLSYT